MLSVQIFRQGLQRYEKIPLVLLFKCYKNTINTNVWNVNMNRKFLSIF